MSRKLPVLKKAKGRNVLESQRHERDVLEFVQAPQPCRVDRDRGVIHGVKIVGFRSKNGGTYSRQALVDAKDLYEGCKCNLNHPSRNAPGTDRDVEDRFGVFRNVVILADGAHADLHYLKSHPFAERACEAAEGLSEVFGFSHNAKTIQVPDGNGGVIHESITKVRSVDLVADPATTCSIFESEYNMDNVPNTQGPASEEGPSGDMFAGSETADNTATATPAAEEPSIENDPVDIAVDALLNKYIPEIKSTTDKVQRKALLDELKKKITAIIEVLSEEEEPEPKPESEPEPESEPKPSSEEKTSEESHRASSSSAIEEALDTLESVGVTPTKIRLKALLAVPKADREALAKSWPKLATTTKPQSSSVLESHNQRRPAAGREAFPTKEQLEQDAKLLQCSRR